MSHEHAVHSDGANGADAHTLFGHDHLPHLRFAPIVPISALTGHNVVNALLWTQRVEEACRMRVPTGELNRLLEEAVKAHPPPSEGAKLRKLNYITQIKDSPPTFLVFGNSSPCARSNCYPRLGFVVPKGVLPDGFDNC